MKSLISKIKANIVFIIINIYLSILGIFWVLLQIYFRLFNNKHSYSLTEIKPFLKSYHDYLFTGFIVLHFGLVIIACVALYRIKYNKQPNKIFLQINNKVSYVLDIVYWKPLDYIYDNYVTEIPGTGKFFLFLQTKLSQSKNITYYLYSFAFIFDVIPRILIAFTFFLEFAIIGHVKYFLYIISLILLPLIFNIMLKLMMSFATLNIPILRSYFSEIKGIGPRYNDKKEIVGYDSYEWTLKEEHYDLDGNEEVTLMIQLQKIESFGLFMKEYIIKINPYIIIITSTLYLIGGIIRFYILYY